MPYKIDPKNKKCVVKEVNESEDFGWVEETSILDFIGKEIMIDIRDLNHEERIKVSEIIKPYVNINGIFTNHNGEEISWNTHDSLLRYINGDHTIMLDKSISLHCGIQDNDYKPLKGAVCFLKTTYENEPDTSNIVSLDGKDLLINQINESEEFNDLNWVYDIVNEKELDITDHIDSWRNKLMEGSVVKITGNYEDMYFKDDIATIVNSSEETGSCLLKFGRIIRTRTDEGTHTHCGENETDSIKCECQPRRTDRDDVGKCWWTNLSRMDKVVYLPFEGKQITESEEIGDFGWIENSLSDVDYSINITGNMEELPNLNIGDVLKVTGEQDGLVIDNDCKIVDFGVKSGKSPRYLVKFKKEMRLNDDSDPTHCGPFDRETGVRIEKDCDCRRTTPDDEPNSSDTVGKCWFVNLNHMDNVLRYPNRHGLVENKKIEKPLLTEGRYDTITRKVVKDIVKKVVGHNYGSHDLPWDVSGEMEYEQQGLSFSVNLELVKESTINNFEVNSSIYHDEEDNVLLMTISVGSNFKPQSYEKLFYKLQEDVRHEIEHFTQKGSNRIKDRPTYKGDTSKLKTVYGHHKNVIEVPALVHGFYRRAKLEKRSIDEIMIEDLDSEIERGLLTKQQAESLLKIWIDYSKKNLPKAVYGEK